MMMRLQIFGVAFLSQAKPSQALSLTAAHSVRSLRRGRGKVLTLPHISSLVKQSLTAPRHHSYDATTQHKFCLSPQSLSYNNLTFIYRNGRRKQVRNS